MAKLVVVRAEGRVSSLGESKAPEAAPAAASRWPNVNTVLISCSLAVGIIGIVAGALYFMSSRYRDIEKDVNSAAASVTVAKNDIARIYETLKTIDGRLAAVQAVMEKNKESLEATIEKSKGSLEG